MENEEYENGIPLEDFFSAYFECRKHKRRTKNQMEFELDYEDNLIELWKEVNEYRYVIGKSICFCITRPKLREVFAADFRDRVVHHIIMQRLNPLFEKEFIEDNYNCRLNKGTLYGVQRLSEKLERISENYTRDIWIGKFDLRGFFMSIDKNILLTKLKAFIRQKYTEKDIDLLLYLVELVVMNQPQEECIIKGDATLWKDLPPNKSLFTCGNNKGIPIGNLTSQIFGNFYLNEFDKIMEKKFHGYYGRYVDDFYVLDEDKSKITSLVPKMRDYLWNELKVTLHMDKVYIQKAYHGVKFIGTVVKKDRQYLGNYTKSNMISAIHSYNQKVCEEKAESFMQTLNSYFGFMKHTKAYAIKREICNSINNEWWNYLEIVGDYKKIKLKKQENS